MRNQNPSQQVIDQRVRNRLIEYLEMVVSYEDDPPWFDLNELLNQWEDWVVQPFNSLYFPSPTFTHRERDALFAVNGAYESFCNVTPRTIRNEITSQIQPEWRRFVLTSREALAILQARGRLSEEVEGE